MLWYQKLKRRDFLLFWIKGFPSGVSCSRVTEANSVIDIMLIIIDPNPWSQLMGNFDTRSGTVES